MKTFKTALVASAVAAFAIPAQAQGLSYSVGLFTSNSDYEVKEDFKPSLNLGVEYDFGNGFYTGIGFVSGQFEDQTKASGEYTFTLGYANELANGLTYDLSASRYEYPNGPKSNDATLALGYGPLTVAFTRGFTSSQFVGNHKIDFTYSHSFTGNLSTDFIITKTQNESDLGYEIAVSYDLGENLMATASINKDTPKLILGLTKSF
jgi:uncharacterized protein (TIGR02001 family)